MHVTFLPSGEQFEAEPDEPILDAALRAGLNPPHSCRAGRCGSCRARLISGSVRYPGPRPLALSDAEARDGHVLLCQARAEGAVTVETRQSAAVAEMRVRSLPCRVQRMRLLAPDVMGLWLRLPAVEPFVWHPGQYVDVMLSGGRRRSFSLANPPHDAALLELHVRRGPQGDFAGQVFGSMTEGTLLRIEGPLGQLAYRGGTGAMVLVGGGTGYAPMKAILRHVLETGVDRPVTLFWGARHRADLYDDAWLRELAARESRFSYAPVLSGPGEEAGTLRGRLDEVVLGSGRLLDDADIYAAGPPDMVAALRDRLAGRGVDPARIVFDSFEFSPDALARIAASPPAADPD